MFEYEGTDHRECALEMLAAIADFAGDVLVPAGVAFEIACLDPGALVESGQPPRPYWFIRGPGFHDAKISEDDVLSVVEDLVPTHAVVTALIDEALAQPAPGITSLIELRWEGGKILLNATNRFQIVTLELDDDGANDRAIFAAYNAGVRRIASRPGWHPA